MWKRTANNTKSVTAHQLDLHTNGLNIPITLDDKAYPIDKLDTKKIRVNSTQAQVLDNGVFYDILHRNSVLQVQNDENVGGKIKEGQPVVVGANMNKKQSPAPFAYVNESGALNSVVLANTVYNDSVMGYTARGKPNPYSQGLCPTGSATHGSLFLRKDGQWGMPSAFTGSVSETFLSLQDTPTTYNLNEDSYLRVSYANGGTVVFDAINTSKVPESTNLYYTDARVDAKIISKVADRTLTNILVSQAVTANEFICDSDIRLKENIENIKNPYHIIDALQPKRYNFKGNRRDRFGLISQEVKEILPDLVNTSGEYEALNYLDLIPILIAAVKDLKSEIYELKNSSKK